MTPSGLYRVHHSGRIRDRARILLLRAVAKGIGPRVSAALQYIEARLLLHPSVWGEHIYRLRMFGFEVYERIHDGIYVVYAVSEGERRVWITRLYPIFGHPLHDPSEPPN